MTAATVAVAGLGAGAAVKSPHALHEVVSQGRAIVGLVHAPTAPAPARVRSSSGTGATSVGPRRAEGPNAIALALRTGAVPSGGAAAGRDGAPRAGRASPYELPDAATGKTTQPARRPEVVAVPDRTAPGGVTEVGGQGSGPLGGSADGSVSAAPTGPLSLVDAILMGRTGAASTQTEASAGTATGADHVTPTSESVASSEVPGSAGGTAPSSGVGVSAHRGPPSTTVGDVLGAVTGAPQR